MIMKAVLLFLLPLTTALLTSSQLAAVVPQLVDQSGRLEDALEQYRAAQILIAAATMKSVIAAGGDNKEADGSDSENDDSDDDSDEDEDEDEDVPTASNLLSSQYNSLLKSLKDPERVQQVRSLSLEHPKSLDAFVRQKEHEAAQKLFDSVAVIRQIQLILQIDQPAAPEISSKMVARLISKLDELQEEFEELESIQKRLQSSKEERRVRARKDLAESQAKIAKIVQKITEIIQN